MPRPYVLFSELEPGHWQWRLLTGTSELIGLSPVPYPSLEAARAGFEFVREMIGLVKARRAA